VELSSPGLTGRTSNHLIAVVAQHRSWWLLDAPLSRRFRVESRSPILDFFSTWFNALAGFPRHGRLEFPSRPVHIFAATGERRAAIW
jgi:hypothetical protein